MALLVPDLDLFISLSGAICMSTLSLITPALLELIVRHPGKTLCGHMAAWVVSSFQNTYHLKYNTSNTTLMYPYVNNTLKN